MCVYRSMMSPRALCVSRSSTSFRAPPRRLSVMKVCRARGIVVDVRFMAPEPAGEPDRRALAERLHDRVAAELRDVLQSS